MFTASRDRWRLHALDGALLWFHPATGMRVRFDAPATRAVRRRAPRLVLFGITNRCNLDCSYCSRDRMAPSAWTEASAFDVLAGLAERGTLEVAFGGGEPLAFPGFGALVRRLAAETPLAVHLTTNGTLLARERLDDLAHTLGEVRLSIHEGVAWEPAAFLLAACGARFGANVMVTGRNLAGLPGLLGQLQGSGARDVALLRYVGPDPALHLDAASEQELARAIDGSPIPIRLSVCFNGCLPQVPRLFGGDCGAGLDFVTLGPDRMLRACSFHDDATRIETADDVLRAWTERRERLLAPATRRGCGRPAAAESASLSDGVRVWRGFSANNSGDCVLVGRFERVEDAERYVRDLLPGHAPGDHYSLEWFNLLEREGVRFAPTEMAPESLTSIGRTVLLHTESAVDDEFPSLRALLWRRGGRAVFSGVHVHEAIVLATGLRFASVPALEDAWARLELGGFDLERRGLDLLGVFTGEVPSPAREDDEDWPALARVSERVEELRRRAAGEGATAAAAELVPLETPGPLDLPAILAAPGPRPGVERLWACFASPEAATTAVQELEGKVVAAGRAVLVEGVAIGPRLGWLLQRQGGTSEVLCGEVLRLVVWLSRGRWFGSRVDPQQAMAGLRPQLPAGDRIEPLLGDHGATLSIDTRDPCATLPAVHAWARGLAFDCWVEAHPKDRLASALHRITSDLAGSGP